MFNLEVLSYVGNICNCEYIPIRSMVSGEFTQTCMQEIILIHLHILKFLLYMINLPNLSTQNFKSQDMNSGLYVLKLKTSNLLKQTNTPLHNELMNKDRRLISLNNTMTFYSF